MAHRYRLCPDEAQGSSSVPQQALRDFDKAMAAFFDPEHAAGKPSYRSRRGTQGFVIRDVKARRRNRNHAEVFVPNCGYVRFRLSRDLPAQAPGTTERTLAEDVGQPRCGGNHPGRRMSGFGNPGPSAHRDVTEILTSLCARLYGRRGAAVRAKRAVEAAVSDG